MEWQMTKPALPPPPPHLPAAVQRLHRRPVAHLPLGRRLVALLLRCLMPVIKMMMTIESRWDDAVRRPTRNACHPNQRRQPVEILQQRQQRRPCLVLLLQVAPVEIMRPRHLLSLELLPIHHRPLLRGRRPPSRDYAI